MRKPNGSITLLVRLPSQETIQLEISRKAKTAVEIKRAIFKQIGLPNTKTVYLSHQGKSFATNYDKITTQSIENYHLTTVCISPLLPGGATTNSEVDENPNEEMSA